MERIITAVITKTSLEETEELQTTRQLPEDTAELSSWTLF
jgi:hypothetical protein